MVAAIPSETPFSVSPNPLTLYETDAIRAVLFKVRFTINKRQGLTVILGDNGLGKSTLMRALHAEYDARPDTISIYVPTPSYTSEFAMLQALCGEVGLPKRRSLLAHQEELFAWLANQYSQGFNIVLFIDEAQRLTNRQLEVVRTLLNFETDNAKLIQVMLAGQLELRARLLSDEHKALHSRLIAPSVLSPLTLEETEAMLAHRCRKARVSMPFDDAAVERIYEHSAGVPRAALRLAAFAYEMQEQFGGKANADLIDQAAQEVALTE
jgi:general secretion pathway protein A